VHVADDGGVPVLYMMSRMIPRQCLPMSVQSNVYQCLHNNVYQANTNVYFASSLHNNIYQCQYRAMSTKVYTTMSIKLTPMSTLHLLYTTMSTNVSTEQCLPMSTQQCLPS
jgi:hypothetical protein